MGRRGGQASGRARRNPPTVLHPPETELRAGREHVKAAVREGAASGDIAALDAAALRRLLATRLRSRTSVDAGRRRFRMATPADVGERPKVAEPSRPDGEHAATLPSFLEGTRQPANLPAPAEPASRAAATPSLDATDAAAELGDLPSRRADVDTTPLATLTGITCAHGVDRGCCVHCLPIDTTTPDRRAISWDGW
jgi:hypothetical protein